MKTPHRNAPLWLAAFLLAGLLPAKSFAQDAGHHVIKRGVVDDDLYLAGGQVDLYAQVNGDVVVAGGQLQLEGDIGADVIAAGGRVDLRGAVADDARLAGGDIRVSAPIGDDLVAAGGRIHLSPLASIGGRGWLTAGEVRIDGEVADELRASGGRIVISGSVNGNVELWADEIVIAETAVIAGRLDYKSAREAVIAPGARIAGEVVHTRVEVDLKPVIAGALFAGLVMLLSFIVAAVVLYLLFPDFSLRVSESLGQAPWLSIGIGLAIFIGAPVLTVVLFSTVLGVWLALILLAVYLVLLLAGYFVGALYLAQGALNRLRGTEAGRAARAAALAGALFVLALINLIPLIGGLLNWVVLLAGTGALSRQVYRMHQA